MKKIIFIVLIVLTICSFQNKRITGDTIRFRVIPNSNSEKDIMIKNEVINEVSKYFINGSIDDVRKNILLNEKNINNSIKNVFEINDYNKSYNVTYGYNLFPKKEYKGNTYSEGQYESLVIELGEAKGDNYWCFLYPALCIEDIDSYEKDEYKSFIAELFDKILNVNYTLK